MADVAFPVQEISQKNPEIGGGYSSNVKQLKSSDGSFEIKNGKLIARDSSGNIVVLIDPNG